MSLLTRDITLISTWKNKFYNDATCSKIIYWIKAIFVEVHAGLQLI